MNFARPSTLLLIIVAATSLQCGITNHAATLKSSVLGFNENLRWRRYDGAASFLPHKDRGPFLKSCLGKERDLFIQSLEIKDVHLNQESETQKAKVLIMAEYYILPSTVVQRKPVNQEWEFSNGLWQLVKSDFEFLDPPRVSN